MSSNLFTFWPVVKKPDPIIKNGLQIRDLRKISDRKRLFLDEKKMIDFFGISGIWPT